MEQRSTPRPLITTTQLKAWLQVSDWWWKDRLENDPTFVEKCVVDLAPEGSAKRTLRFNVAATAEYLGIPTPADVPDTPTRKTTAA